MSFHVGQKVVCVGGKIDAPDVRWNTNWPACVNRGGTFTIRELDSSHGIPAVRLREYHHPINRYGWETAFPAACFRPLKTTSAGLAILNSLLLPKPKRQRAKVTEAAR